MDNTDTYFYYENELQASGVTMTAQGGFNIYNQTIINGLTSSIFGYTNYNIWNQDYLAGFVLNPLYWNANGRGPEINQANGGIDSNYDAVYQYLFGDGSPQAIGPNTTRALMNTETFRNAHNSILRGERNLSGRFGVDMTDIVFHIGRTRVGYNANVKNQTITYTLYEGDGFWDPDFIDERVLGEGLGIPMFQPDGMGPNLERLGGTPYEYIPTVIIVPMTLMIFPFR